MTIFNITLTVSDVIDLIGICASLFVGIVAIGISILSLRQNSKMIEESTRPNIQIYPVFLDDIVYIVIRNFGNSEAVIDELKCYHRFTPEEYLGDPNSDDFAKLNGSSFCPGYSIRCPLAAAYVSDGVYEFKIKYHSTTHKYEQAFSFNLCNATPFPDTFPTSKTSEESLRNIFRALHNLVKLRL